MKSRARLVTFTLALAGIAYAKQYRYTRLLVPLNKLLAEKATKIYSASPVWLLIRSAFPLWEQDDFMTHRSNILVPEVHPFEQIWLLCGAQASAGVLRLA